MGHVDPCAYNYLYRPLASSLALAVFRDAVAVRVLVQTLDDHE
jgi:hypothetical protein